MDAPVSSLSSSDPKVSTLLATAETYLSVFTTLDATKIAEIQSENYKQEWAPKSVNPPDPMNREQFAHHLTHLREVLQSFPVRAKQTWPNPLLNQVIVWADSETVFHKNVKGSDSGDPEEWRYRGEYVFVLTMDESGRRIEHVLEFVDSKGTERLRGLMAKARENAVDNSS